MYSTIFILLAFLDFQNAPAADERIEKEFTVSTFVEESLTGCAENGQGGAYGGDTLRVDWNKSPDQHAVGSQSASPSNGPLHVVPLINTNDQREWVITTSGSSIGDGTASSPNPDPNPPTPPMSNTPEPSTFAILGITAVTLLFLLFGRRFGRRLARRI